MKKAFISLILIIFFIFGLSKLFDYNKCFDKAVSCIVYPILFLENKFFDPIIHPFLSIYNNFSKVKYLLDEISVLKEKNSDLFSENIELRAKGLFLSETKELTDFSKRYDPNNFFIVKILAKHFDAEHYFLIDAGFNKNLEPDMVVLYKNCLVGKISKVYQYYSKVILITDPACKVSAICNDINAIHEGMGDIRATLLSFVNHLQEVNIDDLVISSGQGLVFPQGFALGVVKQIDSDIGFHLKIRLQPCVDFESIQYCIVLKKN